MSHATALTKAINDLATRRCLLEATTKSHTICTDSDNSRDENHQGKNVTAIIVICTTGLSAGWEWGVMVMMLCVCGECHHRPDEACELCAFSFLCSQCKRRIVRVHTLTLGQSCRVEFMHTPTPFPLLIQFIYQYWVDR